MRYVLFYLLFVFFSCKNTVAEGEPVCNFSLKKYLQEIPDYAYTFGNEDSILFSFSKGTTNIDTSWVLFVVKKNNAINFHYNHILPYSVTGFNDYLDESKKLLCYEGFSFNVNEQFWEEVVDVSGIDKYFPQDTILYRGCFHCPEYRAYYNSKIIIGGQNDRVFLSMLDSLIHHKILSSVFDKKKNPPIKLQQPR
jgi:hypothetical protein